MEISKEQLALVNERIAQLLQADSFYGHRLREQGIDGVASAEDFRRPQGGRTGQALVDVLQAPPCRDVEFALAPSVAAPVRDVELL